MERDPLMLNPRLMLMLTMDTDTHTDTDTMARDLLMPSPRPRLTQLSSTPPAMLSNNSQFFFQLNDLHLSSLCSLLSSLKLRFHLLKSLLDLLILLICFFSLVSGRLQFLLKLAHSLLILFSSVLQNLPHSVRVISSSSSL